MRGFFKHLATHFPTFDKKYHLLAIATILIFSIGFFLSFYRLADIPNGLYPDETAIGYNAYSILQTGKDEYGVSYPLYFRSFDDYKMPVYIYSTTLAIKVFGVNAFAVRFMSALFGWLGIIALYFLIIALSKNKYLALIASLFLTLNPWHVFFSRVGYEVNVATSLLVIGTLFFVIAVNKKNNFFLFFISIVSFILSLYTYNVTRLIAPLLFLTLVWFYYKKITITSKKLLTTLGILFFIGMLPFLITLVSLQSQPGFASQQDALITGKVAKVDILQTRSYFTSLPSIVQKVFFNYWVLVIWQFFSNLISFLSTVFFFTKGPEHPYENIQGFGMFYFFDLPFILLGIYQGIKKRIVYLYPFYIWLFFILIVSGVVVPFLDTYGTKTYEISIPLIIFSAFGFYSFIKMLTHIKNYLLKSGIIIIVLICIAFSYLFYFTSYFVRFPVEQAKEWHAEDQQTVAYIRSNENKYNTIIFDDSSHFLYTYLLFYGQYPPQLHQQQAVYVPDGLVDTVIKDGKYEFRKIDWSKDLAKAGTLIITGKDNVPSNRAPLAVFNYPTRPVVIYYNRNIAQYPTTDTAYEIFQSGNE